MSSNVGKSVILEEEMEDNYQPTEQEVHDYAKWLGMDLETESSLMWIAREGLKAPLPPDWKPCRSPDEEIYYFNFSTGESVWEHPCDKHYKNLFEEERENLRRKRMHDEAFEESGNVLSTSIEDFQKPSNSVFRSSPTKESNSPAKKTSSTDSDDAMKSKQNKATKEVDLKFQVWQQQLLNSTEAKKKKLTLQHEAELSSLQEKQNEIRQNTKDLIASLQAECERLHQEAKSKAEETKKLLSEEDNKYRVALKQAEDPVALGEDVKREAKAKAKSTLEKQIEDEVQSECKKLKEEIMARKRAEIDSEIDVESKMYRDEKEKNMQQIVDDEVQKQIDDRKEASFLVMYSELEVEKAKIRQARLEEIQREVADEVSEEKSKLKEDSMTTMKREVEAFRESKLRELIDAERDKLEDEAKKKLTEIETLSEGARSDAKADALEQLKKEVQAEVSQLRDGIKSEIMANAKSEIELEVKMEAARLRQEKTVEMKRRIEEEIREQSVLYKDKIQADMAKELEEDEEILQEDQMKTLHLEKETVHESGTSNTISAKPVDVQNQKKDSVNSESIGIQKVKVPCNDVLDVDYKEPTTKAKSSSARRTRRSMKDNAISQTEDGIIDMIDRRMEDLRLRHIVISESRRIWHSMMIHSRSAASDIVNGKTDFERMSMKRNIEREARCVKDDVRSLRALKSLNQNYNATENHNFTSCQLDSLLSGLENQSSRQQQQLGNHSEALAKLRMRLNESFLM